MALITKELDEQLDSLLSAAHGGLPAAVRDLIVVHVKSIREYPEWFRSRQSIQLRIDTLINLVDLWVHRDNWSHK